MSRLQRIQPPLFPVNTGLIPEAHSAFLKNNVPIFHIEAGTEEIMRIEFIFRAGLVKEYLPLLATSTNMMLTEGTKGYSSEELNRILDYYGVFLNLYAEKDSAGIIICFLNKHIEKVLELSREILFRPSFPDKELSILMKKRLRWYLNNREKVQNLAMDQFFESVFGSHHPYGRQVREPDFEGITSAVLTDYHSKYYNPENMAVIVSGKIHEKTNELLDLYFGGLLSNNIYMEDPENYIEGDKRKKVHIKKQGAVQSALRIGSSTINKRHLDYPGLKFLDSLLGGYFGSRLMKNIREDKGYTYGIHSAVSSLDLTGFKVISTEVSKRNTKKAIDEIYKEIKLLQTKPVERDEMAVVRNYMSGEMVRMFDGPFALADSFKAAWEFGLDNTYYHRLAEKIKTIKPDEIMWLAKTYYNIDELYEIIAG
jgi:zinc protease